MNAEPDEDGWVTVTSHGKKKGAPRTEIRQKKVTAKQKKKNKEKVVHVIPVKL